MKKSKTLTAERLKKAAGRNRLMNDVADWVIKKGDDYDDLKGPFEDLFRGGCEAGTVSHLVYYKDTVPYAKKHMQSILMLAMLEAEQTGEGNLFTHLGQCRGLDNVGDGSQALNFLAWYGFETAARKLAERLGLDV